jgi:hypothetical protein
LQRLWDSTSLFGFVGMRQRGWRALQRWVEIGNTDHAEFE